MRMQRATGGFSVPCAPLRRGEGRNPRRIEEESARVEESSSFGVVHAGGVACWRSVNFLGALSTFDEFVSADNVAIMGQLQDEDYVADVVPTTTQGDSNKEIDDGPLPTSSEVISAFALVRRYCVNMEGCGLSCSNSLDNVEACMLSQAAWSLKQKKIQDYFVPK
ncbi:hypothetical protein HPB50_025851 [Hyalomma asiaticum]|uniref:Uncharacterized protein n=1 Tax=Hyalomma asiaticum TaxID=266040 RepID=A0ACB7TR75_HYAAI|nr:hypothetical protein HPB50_025851 [Hyalomma asiaticum]